MDPAPHLASASDLETRVSRISDPAIPLKIKQDVAIELREMVDSLRDAEATRIFPQMLNTLLETTRSLELTLSRDTLDFQFRRTLIEIVHRIPCTEAIRSHTSAILVNIIAIVKNDTEENAITCIKSLHEILRINKQLPEEHCVELVQFFLQLLRNMAKVVTDFLSENSPPMDMNTTLLSYCSPKVLMEIPFAIMVIMQTGNGHIVNQSLPEILNASFEVLSLQSPLQKAAREKYEATGEIWVGEAPDVINKKIFNDFISAQTKLLNFCSYMFRTQTDQQNREARGDEISLCCIRLLQDCPVHNYTSRRELLNVIRQQSATPFRRAFVPHFNKLLVEQIILGSATLSHEPSTRTPPVAIVIELAYQLRNEFSVEQLGQIIYTALHWLLNSTAGVQVPLNCGRLFISLAEPFQSKIPKEDAVRLLDSILKVHAAKLAALDYAYQEATARTRKQKLDTNDEQNIDVAFIERDRAMVVSADNPEGTLSELRFLFRTLLSGCRMTIGLLKRLGGNLPDGETMIPIFDHSINIFSSFENVDFKDEKEPMDHLALMLTEINLHVFQEIWTKRTEEFIRACVKRVSLLHLFQQLLQQRSVSQTIIATTLSHLTERLDALGSDDDKYSSIFIRLFKLIFSIIGMQPETSEPLLALHLGRLIMDSFPLAAKSNRPLYYFHLMRGLFRAIGSGGGRYEKLYQEVLPLLPEMLDCLIRQLLAADAQTRDLLVELCLTVPLRLTHLLPHLHYLMKPLVLALQGGPELVSQGLRTLELCIDNLISDFLDPILRPVLRDLMEALHSHLKPLPGNHHHAHTTIRILGKLGGRSRRLLDEKPSLSYRHYADPARIAVSFSGRPDYVPLGPVAQLASRILSKQSSSDRVHAYNYLEHSLTYLLNEDLQGQDKERTFTYCMEGLFEAIHIPEVQARAEEYLRTLARHIFSLEAQRTVNKDAAARRYPGHIFGLFLDSFPSIFVRADEEQTKKAIGITTSVVHDLIPILRTYGLSPQEILTILHMLATKFSTFCFEDSWLKKSAGCSGIMIMTTMPFIGRPWTLVRGIDLVRTIIHVLKDSPHDPPCNISEIKGHLLTILRIIFGPHNDENVMNIETGPQPARKSYIVSIFLNEISSSHPIIRETARTCIALLSEIYGESVIELSSPHRERVVKGLFMKPLRSLPHAFIIGQVEAVRYCMEQTPPLLEPNDECMRLLHEALALVDNSDTHLIGKADIRRSSIEGTQLRVSCLKLLTAALPLTDSFSRIPATRQKVTAVFFRSLYASQKDVVDAAHEGLKIILGDQSRFPKDILQTGLRPILMNLSDTKKLTIEDLDGLSRLLMLLSNYFRVEIGHKLLGHFRAIAEPQVLQNTARVPLIENDAIKKLVRLVNIFHLLPVSAVMFLKDLVDSVVQTETYVMACTQSPFSEPLGKYLDRNPSEAVDFFLSRGSSPRHVQTLRNILNADVAPKLLNELSARPGDIAKAFLLSDDETTIVSGILLSNDISNRVPGWTRRNEVVERLLSLWKIEREGLIVVAPVSPILSRKHQNMFAIFMKTLEESPRIDMLFDLITVYSVNVAMDRTQFTHFLYNHVAISGSFQFRRNILLRFLTWFDDHNISWERKTYFMRHVISPMLLVHSSRSEEESLLDKHIVDILHSKIWRANDTGAFETADDMFRIELLHLTTILIHKYHQLFSTVKKDVVKFVWAYISSDDHLVKQMAFLLAARFFAAYDSPAKFIMRTWTGLLQPPHADGNRYLTKQALDILAPIVQKMPQDPTLPHWARTTRRLLAEESTGNSQLVIIYQLISRQPDLFYPVRAHFIPHIINSLSKIGIQSTTSSEGRILSLDILEVIYKWEQRSLQPGEETHGWVTPHSFRETLISYLTRTATGFQDAMTRTNVVARSLVLLKNFLSLSEWADVNFKLDYFRKPLCEYDYDKDTGPAIVANARVLNVVCSERSDQWIMQNSTILQSLIQKGMQTDDSALHDSLHPITERLLTLYPLPKEDEDNTSELAELHTFVYNSISESLKNVTYLRGALLLLKSVVQTVPERIEPFAAPLMRVLSKLAREHATSSSTSEGYDAQVRLIISILKICQSTPMLPTDTKKIHFSCLMVLVEKSTSQTLCQFLLDMTREWALHRRDVYPTMKDKAALLQKMASFESRGTDLFNQYLELIYDIYTEPSLRRSDLTSRLEQAFILGCRSHDTSLRERFTDLLDNSIPRSLMSRLTYVLGVQSWDSLADHNWIYLALDLLLSSIDAELPLTSQPSATFNQTSSPLALTIANSRIRNITRPMRRLLFYDAQVAHDTWVSIFSTIWSLLSRKEQADVTQHLIVLLSREYHIRQSELRPNVIQALLEGIHACTPSMNLPAHLLKYLAKTFGAWHVVMELLQNSLETIRDDDGTARDTIYDALAEVYAELIEEDMFYGLWRRRSLHHETNVALTYEQNGMWPEAQISYEQAQNKARGGSIPFTESEYCLWEDHWILATEKLQQWDILYDLARNDGNHELLLEAAWRNKDWSDKDQLQVIEEQIQGMSEVGTPRRRVYEAFIALVKLPHAVDKNIEFTRILEDAMQLSLRKWIAFPSKMSSCHIPLLQHFQQFVELQEAVQIFGSLSTTNASNLEKKSSELKLVLQAWRERLPNLHDDINVWSDLVAWRQNVFGAINKHYLPLIQANGQNGTQGNTPTTYGYRGFHETAWIINRFAHVARKHDLFDVAQQSLTRIYELPNIEISEAFLKLREEARCRLQVPERILDGLNLINNTNLSYFSSPQKSEFYTLKGMFYSAQGDNANADDCFAQAVQMDMNVAKAWAEWGRFNDKLFNSQSDTEKAGPNAIQCYLQAAGLYKNYKSRPLLTRVLWLLSIDDPSGANCQAFSTYNGDRALWFWVTLIPQLLQSLSSCEALQAQRVLVELAKAFPQALFFPLRSLKEELTMQRVYRQNQQIQAQNGQNNVKPEGNGSSDSQQTTEGNTKEDWKLVEEVAALLKSTNPLLVLTLETMVDQFIMRFKATAEEEIYRFTNMLLTDAIQNACHRGPMADDDMKLSELVHVNIVRLANHLGGSARKDYDDDFITSKPLLPDYIQRLQHWRDRYEKFLDGRPRLQSLDLISHWLVEFQYSKYDEIEVPGQYLELVDGPQQFSRIRQFGPKFEMSRGPGFCFKRFVIFGHDGVKYTFAVQQPAARWVRREDRVMQLFRTFNHALTRRKESRKRNLQFHLPLALSLGPAVRLIINDSSYISLQDVYDQHCEELGVAREDPILMVPSRVREIVQEMDHSISRAELQTIRRAIYDEVCKKMIPDDILSRYMMRTMCGPQELWRMRKTFTLQLAACSFMTYTVCITSRGLSRYQVSRSTGQIFMSELLCGINGHTALFTTTDNIPFRFTPNMQHFVTAVGTEALFCPGIVAIARALTKPEFDLDQQLCLFTRDEASTLLYTARRKRISTQDSWFRSRVTENINNIVARAELMACKMEKTQGPKDEKITQSMQSVSNLISQATNPLNLVQMPDLFEPWF